MDDQELRAIERRAAQAMPGPWVWGGAPAASAAVGPCLETTRGVRTQALWSERFGAGIDQVLGCDRFRVQPPGDAHAFYWTHIDLRGEDAAFIAGAREDIPRLTRALRDAWAALAYYADPELWVDRGQYPARREHEPALYLPPALLDRGDRARAALAVGARA